MDRKWKFCCLGTLMAMLAGTVVAAPGAQAESLEAASLQLGALQAQAQYAPSALQGARAASRSAASCLVTAVQYTHGQQIWRADPCEFCLCLDGEMFCWWQECPPAAPGPCPNNQPFSLCGNSSISLDPHPAPPPQLHKIKRTQYKKTTTTTTASPSATATITTSEIISKTTGSEEEKKAKSKEKASSKVDKKKKSGVKQRRKEEASSNYTTVESGVYETQTETFEGTKEPSKGSSPSLDASNNGTESSRAGCLVMGVEYQIGQTLPSTGSCLVCRCSEGGSSGARVSCAPRGCAPMDAAALTDDPESF